MARSTSAQGGRPYEPPKIYRVRIAGDELAVTGCKSLPGHGPNPPSCLKSICKGNGS